MLYFVLMLLIECAASVLLTLLLLRAVRNSLRNRVRRAWLYPLPSLLAVLLVAFTLLFTVPALIDAEQGVFGAFPTRTVTVERVAGWGRVWADGEHWNRAPWEEKPEVGGTYQIAIAPRSRMILRIESVAGTDS